MPMPCTDHVVLLKATTQHGHLSKAVLCCGLEKNGMFGAWHGHGVASVNQTRPHCVNQMGKTHSKPLAARKCKGTTWARHGKGTLYVNRPLTLPGLWLVFSFSLRKISLTYTVITHLCHHINRDNSTPSLFSNHINPYPTAFPYGNGMVLHFYQQQESSTTKTVHKVINKGLKAYV